MSPFSEISFEISRLFLFKSKYDLKLVIS